MNASLSEDSVADTAISKRNSDGMLFMIIRFTKIQKNRFRGKFLRII